MTDKESFFDGEWNGFIKIEDPATQEEIRQAAKKFMMENGSTVAYHSEKPEIKEPKPPVNERDLPGEKPDTELLEAVMNEIDREISLEIGGHVQIQTKMSYKKFLRL